MTDARPIAGYEGLYSVFPDGRVWSHGRVATGRDRKGNRMVRNLSPRFLAEQTNGAGRQRPRVQLWAETGCPKHFYVCDLVRAAFGAEALKTLPANLRKTRIRRRA